MWFTDLAVLAGVSVRTGAVILVRLRVHARPPVLTGPVGPAVVQICTENTGETHSFYHIFWGGGGWNNKGRNRVGCFDIVIYSDPILTID